MYFFVATRHLSLIFIYDAPTLRSLLNVFLSEWFSHALEWLSYPNIGFTIVHVEINLADSAHCCSLSRFFWMLMPLRRFPVPLFLIITFSNPYFLQIIYTCCAVQELEWCPQFLPPRPKTIGIYFLGIIVQVALYPSDGSEIQPTFCNLTK